MAALGLAVYALFYLAMIKIIPITLTLPGIAGLILTIGVAADSNIVIFERIKEELRLGRSTLSAIAQGYRKGIATIIDANVITLLTAFILFVLASAGVKGFAFTLGIGTIVSLFTAVLFTQAFLAVMGRSRLLSSNKFLGAGERSVEWNFDFSGMSKYFFAASGAILVIGAVAFSTQQLNLGIDFESGTRIKAALAEEASAEEVRSALSDAGIDGADAAEIQAVDDEEFGANVIQIQAKIPPAQAPQVQEVLSDSFNGLEGGEQGFQNESVGPTFGQQVAKNAVRALILSLIVISIYVAIRFEAKYAVPVLIALAHDILITGGIYALAGLEVSSATVAAFLTILGYSMYDTIIVFDRIRENVPRMPRAAFTQIVNRSMAEVLTRSLITGLSTVFLVGMLLVFGDETLRGFALAMMVGIASGTYSSIFIAGPVLTEWKEREPQYRARRHHIEETMGYVPVFPEDNVVARVEGHSDEGDGPQRKLISAGRPWPRRFRQTLPTPRRRPARPRPAPCPPTATSAPRRLPERPVPPKPMGRERTESRPILPWPSARPPSASAAASAKSAASTGGTADGSARLVHRRRRALALHRLLPRPLLGRHRRCAPWSRCGRDGHRGDRPDPHRRTGVRDGHRHSPLRGAWSSDRRRDPVPDRRSPRARRGSVRGPARPPGVGSPGGLRGARGAVRPRSGCASLALQAIRSIFWSIDVAIATSTIQKVPRRPIRPRYCQCKRPGSRPHPRKLHPLLKRPRERHIGARGGDSVPARS